MHKYFAKSLFLGKKVDFLPECHSTNDELNQRVKNNEIPEGYLILTDHQVKGRGQRGNAWLSDPGKNLLFSFFIKPKFLLARQAYLLNIISGLAVIKILRPLIDHKTLSLKWPNDAFVDDRKIAGILVETSVETSGISSAVIGIGLNVNQDFFHLNSATSVKMETNQTIDREMLLEEFLVAFESYYLKLKAGHQDQILETYYSLMRWRGEVHRFRSRDLDFDGEIIGINEVGRLVIKTHHRIESFDVKEVEFLY